ncbi:MAG: hypothetical protein AAF934_12215, partial [Bacteroidota bacterium]
AIYPNCFSLEEVKTAKLLMHFVLYQNGDPKLLNRIACTPELEDIAEMYQDATIGKQIKTPETTTALKQWKLVSNRTRPNWFNLEDTETAKVLGTFVLPKGSDSKTLHRIAVAPKLECIAKTYYKYLADSMAKDSIVFAVVKEVLHRLEQEYPYTIAP